MKTVRLAKATTSPTLFLAKQRYVPSSVTRTPWICSQPVTSYFWGPPLNCKKRGFLSALVAEARGSLYKAPGPLFQQAVRSQDCSGNNHAIFCLSPGINKFPDSAGLQLCLQATIMVWWPGQRTVEFPPARQGSPAWGEDPQSLPATSYGEAQRTERWKGAMVPSSTCSSGSLHSFHHSFFPIGAWLRCMAPLPLPTPSNS